MIVMAAIPFFSFLIKRLTSHYVILSGYPSCDYPHIRPHKIYMIAHFRRLNDLADPLKWSAVDVWSVQTVQIRFFFNVMTSVLNLA